MRNRQKAVPLWKICHFSRFSGHFQNSRIPGSQNSGFRILEFWNSGILEFWKWPIWRKKNAYHFCLQMGHFQNSRILELRNPEFWDPRNVQDWKNVKKSLIFPTGTAFWRLRIDSFCENCSFSWNVNTVCLKFRPQVVPSCKFKLKS